MMQPETYSSRHKTGGTSLRYYATERWVASVTSVLDLPYDPRTMRDWAHALGSSITAIRVRCAAVRCAPKSSLDLARVLRAVCIARATGEWDPANLLDITDNRTLCRLMEAAGLKGQVADLPTVEQVLAAHHFVIAPSAMNALARALALRQASLVSREDRRAREL